jgi:cellulose synthase/poly-beta-1,6-N-acetylglucosamine synthase-like glycosyltransferase
MKPKVSVVMPVLNGERFIGEAIQSVVDQTYTHCELIVVDDGCTDGTRAQVDAFRDRLEIRYVRHDRPHGIAPSMNDGVRNATGDLIAFLDHDDAWFPEFLETQANYLATHPDVAMVHADFQTIDVGGAVIEASVAACRGRTRPSGHVFRELFMDSFIVGNSVLIKRECFDRLGMFDESLHWGDYHMWLRIARHYKVDYVDRVLTKYRQHPTQSTRSTTTPRADQPPVAMKVIEKILEAYPELHDELGEQTIRRRKALLHFDLAYGWYVSGEIANAGVCAKRALRLWPTNGQLLKLYVACLLGPAAGRMARAAWHRLRGREGDVADGVRGITG